MSDTVETGSQKEAAEMYLDGTYLGFNKTWHVEDSLWKAKQIRNILAKNRISPDTVCEVGCGAGEILKQLSLDMPNTSFSGYELSPQAFEFCKMRESEKVKYFMKDILREDIYFDSLLCIDVFEHVEDCFGFIRGLRNKARYKIFHIPLDISVLSVARGFMLACRETAGHIHYYTRESALAILKDCGYEILDESYTIIFEYHRPKSLKGKLLQFLQRISFALSPHLAVRFLGGCSLIVLAK